MSLAKEVSILALHGFTGCGEDFFGFSDKCKLVSDWYCPNLPGHRIDMVPGVNKIMCDPASTRVFLQNYIKEISPSPKLLLGYSMGARAALHLALANPNNWRAIILISPNPGIKNERDRKIRRDEDHELANRIEIEGVSSFIKSWKETPLIKSQKNIRADWQKRMHEGREQHSSLGLATSLREFGQGNCPYLLDKLNIIKMPVLILTGMNDTNYCKIASQICERLTHAEHVTIKNSGHMPHLERPDESAKIMDQFVSKIGFYNKSK